MQKPQQSKNNIQILITNKLKRLTLFDYFMGILLVGITVFFIFTFSRTERTVLVDLTFERVGQGEQLLPSGVLGRGKYNRWRRSVQRAR